MDILSSAPSTGRPRLSLQEFISQHRDDIIRRCRGKATPPNSVPPAGVAAYGVPLLLDQLMEALRGGLSSSPEIVRTAGLHGHERLLQGVTMAQLVHDYGDVCQSITELALETGAPIAVDEFRMLNGYLDEAIAGAVTQFGHERQESATTDETTRADERLGFFVHELRNLLGTSIVAFEVLRSGTVGVTGSTGAVLYRSLMGLRSLIDRALAEVRITQGVQSRVPFLVSEFIDEITPGATLAANAEGLTLIVQSTEKEAAILADRQVLAAVLTNLLQNAFKFTQPRTTVTLEVSATPERVLIEVLDECGGLPPENVENLFRPFQQRGANRTGLGLGLAFSRRAVEANDGRIRVRDRPGVGCTFTVDLPRLQVCPVGW